MVWRIFSPIVDLVVILSETTNSGSYLDLKRQIIFGRFLVHGIKHK
jgi:hypothetical protein